jgi:hypothetical protein
MKVNGSVKQRQHESVDEKLRRQESNCLQHGTRMNNGMPKIMLNCRTSGRRRLGRPLKRLLDEAEAGLLRPPRDELLLLLLLLLLLRIKTTWEAMQVSKAELAPEPFQTL